MAVRGRVVAMVAAAVALAALSGCASQVDDLSVKVALFGGPSLSDGTMALQGAPAPGVNVTVRDSTGRTWSTVTDTSAVALFRVPPGNYTVFSNYCGQPEQVSVAAGQPVSATIECSAS